VVIDCQLISLILELIGDLKMKLARALCFAALTLGFVVPAMADCMYPKTPADPPSGATSTLDQMKAAKSLTNKYAEEMKTYLNCLDSEADAAIAALGPDHKPDQEEPIKNKRDLKYDAAEKTMLKYTDAMNAEIRAYKAAHP
jgi:hypothetical protein